MTSQVGKSQDQVELWLIIMMLNMLSNKVLFLITYEYIVCSDAVVAQLGGSDQWRQTLEEAAVCRLITQLSLACIMLIFLHDLQ